MTIYYKGLITLKKNIKLETIKFETSGIEKNSEMYLNRKHSRKLNKEDIECLYKNIYNKYKNASYDLSQISDILFKVNPINFKSSINILYEELIDEKGQRYAKEKDSDLIFPLFNQDDLEDCFLYFDRHYFLEAPYFKGKFSTDFKLRDNFSLCDCYCIADGVANRNEIKKYPYHDYVVLEEFFNMNVFDDIRINNNSQQTINSSPTSINCDNSLGSIGSSINQSFISSNKSNNYIQLIESLENIKNFLISLSDDEKSLLQDIAQNNLLNYTLGWLIQISRMSKEDLLNILSEQSSQKNADKSNPVLLAKKSI